MVQQKEYISEIILGIETDTLDPTGKIVKTADIPNIDKQSILDVLADFTGDIMQEPPMYSALKYNGIPLYKLARKGITVDRKKRMVNISDIELLGFADDRIYIKVKCGRGTYIRSLARDIALSLNTVGHLKILKRTRIGDFDERACIKITEFPKWLSAKI